MIWSMADLKVAQSLRVRRTTPFWQPTDHVGRGLEETMRERFRQRAKEAELVVHPHDIVVQMDDPIYASDMIANGDWHGYVYARWEPRDRGIAFTGMGEPADQLFAGLAPIEGWHPDPNDTITLEVDWRQHAVPKTVIQTHLIGWSEEERTWVYGPKPGFSEESGDLAGNGRVTVSLTVA